MNNTNQLSRLRDNALIYLVCLFLHRLSNRKRCHILTRTGDDALYCIQSVDGQKARNHTTEQTLHRNSYRCLRGYHIASTPPQMQPDCFTSTQAHNSKPVMTHHYPSHRLTHHTTKPVNQPQSIPFPPCNPPENLIRPIGTIRS